MQIFQDFSSVAESIRFCQQLGSHVLYKMKFQELFTKTTSRRVQYSSTDQQAGVPRNYANIICKADPLNSSLL